ncbi:hypothetical protein D9619_005813 [Psilocybe cf. subviscida]|uniref:Pali-domain-containing protein n=1 Tax=Psilocybe cf. subviscida TaxID=2480587 RepID=A0A8H5FB80_9AGAR|nr:hypothetical protein D9619_005813 [Psilocybe cf. subviscida]
MFALAALTPVLVLAAFILLLLVSLSVPIIKSIFLFRLAANASSSLFNSSANASVKFGVWGYCTSAVQVAIAGIAPLHAYCNNVNGLDDKISKASTAALVLHPIAAGLAFLTLVFALFILRRGSNGTSRLPSLLTMGIGSLAAVITTAAFLIDVIVVAIVRKRVRDATDGDVNLIWGNAVWMTLGAAIALWLSIILACCGVFTFGRGRRNNAKYNHNTPAATY